MFVRKKIVLIFILMIFLLSGCLADSKEEDNLSNRVYKIGSGIKANYSFPENMELLIKFRGIKNAGAESRRYPLKGYVMLFDLKDLGNMTDEELKGLLSHEFSHIETYSGMNWIQLSLYASIYLISDKFRMEVERNTDILAIQKGFGRELASFRKYRIRTANKKDKKLVERYYLSVDEINNLTKQN